MNITEFVLHCFWKQTEWAICLSVRWKKVMLPKLRPGTCIQSREDLPNYHPWRLTGVAEGWVCFSWRHVFIYLFIFLIYRLKKYEESETFRPNKQKLFTYKKKGLNGVEFRKSQLLNSSSKSKSTHFSFSSLDFLSLFSLSSDMLF